MTEVTIERRIRQPKDKAALIEQLLHDNDGPFTTKAEVMIFAAAFGWSRNRRESFTESLEPIRYYVIARTPAVDSFIKALGVLAYPDQPQILSAERVDDRITVFEEYANGGLMEIQSEINTSRATVREVLAELVRRESETERPDDLPEELGRLLPGTWS